ncbi:hypothetical protein SAMN05443572_1011109 [Myxococcus fulvus]|uniref:Lipoprotein n=1 Tax=Myxococcus fulvus TaxID=33 RepID=A0A511SUY1_MYXFU|nr:hypothetical protein [Myxococcus fulvus]AKF84919.1 hypothetical protein MFUL124B02_06485 [Myxococcus fulvus 124B02]GEN05347.1 hypothetical protein MFU01_03840 [Myxococcus fulvus]SET10256.1 hypothetical protein SAMN05443572_1011109 [Myxococcus fulvus]
MRHAAAVALVMLCSLPALAARREGTCEVRVMGGLQLAFSGKGGTQSATSDHWLSPEEMRAIYEKIHSRMKADPKKAQAAAAKLAAKGTMSGPLSIHCISAGGIQSASLSILSGQNTKESVPFKPGAYPLVTLDEKPGELPVALRLKGVNYMLTVPGVLVLTRFDGRGVAGTFKFTARTHSSANKKDVTERTIRVEGSFDLPCPVKSRVCS